MRANALTLAGLLALATPAFAPPAFAQSVCPGHVSATAIHPVPPAARIAVALRDNSPRQERLRDAVNAVLRREGHPVGDPAAFTLSWRGRLDPGGVVAGGGPTRSDLMFRERDSFQDSDDLSWVQAVPSARGSRRATPEATFRLTGSVELREVVSGRVAWTAVFSCDRRGDEDAALIDTLAAAIVPVIGQTVSGRRF